MKNDEMIQNELTRAEKEIELWKERSKSWSKKVREVIGDVTLNMYKNINETGEFRFLIKDQLMYLLNSMFDGKPLTPLTGEDDEWKPIAGRFANGEVVNTKYQNTRYNDLFKDVNGDGTIIYHDNNRVSCYDPIMENYFSFGLVNKICDEIYPIAMPYMPGDSDCEVQVFTFQYNQENSEKSDFDTVIVLSAHTKEGKNIPINRFFREPNEGESPTYGSWVEINIAELKDRIDNGPMKNLDLIDLGLDGVYHNYIEELEEE